jgi:uncharacterized protein (DUF488 family)
MKLYTIGAYGKSEDEFFDLLIKHNITCFFDIRQRRGVRGSKYKFVNSKYLQNRLMTLGIRYEHIKELAPTSEIRQIQKNHDAASSTYKRDRQLLSEEFCCLYDKVILENYKFSQEWLDLKGGESIVFFCVEEEHTGCHRSLVTEKLKKINSLLEIVHL